MVKNDVDFFYLKKVEPLDQKNPILYCFGVAL